MKSSIITALLLLLLFTGCAGTEYRLDENFNRPVRMTPFTSEEGYRLKKRVRYRARRHNVLWGLIFDLKPTLADMLNQIEGVEEGEVIGNLVIEEQYTFLDSVFDLLTVGFYRPYSVIIYGDIFEKSGGGAQ